MLKFFKHKLPNKRLNWFFYFVIQCFCPPPVRNFPKGFYSPNLKFTEDCIKLVKDEINNFILGIDREVTFLDVGGRHGEHRFLANNLKYSILEIDNTVVGNNIIFGDICNCPIIPNSSFDIVYSNNVFEHLKNPFSAAKESIRILKKNGLLICVVPFSARYHPVPIDCFRYTHEGLIALFENKNKIQRVFTGYDISGRRNNKIGGKIKGGLDCTVVDELGGWRENWKAIYIGKKC